MENAQSDEPEYGEPESNGLKSKATSKVRKLSISAKETAEGRVRELGSAAKTRTTEKVRDISSAARTKAGTGIRDLGSTAKTKAETRLEEQRERIATRFDEAASGLRQHANGDGLRGDAERRVAERLEVTAQYLHAHQAPEVARDLSETIRRHPIRSVAIAGIIGFLLARILR